MVRLVPHKGKLINIKLLDRLKQALVEEGLVTREQLKVAELKGQRENEPLSRALLTLRFVTEEQLARFIGDKAHIPYINIRNYTIDRKILELVPEKIARRYHIIPLFKIEDVLTVAMEDPLDVVSLDELSKVAGYEVEAVIASDQSIDAAIDQWYGLGEAREMLEEQRLKGEPAIKVYATIGEGISGIHGR